MYDDHSQIMPQENYPDALRPGYHAPNDVKSVCHQYLNYYVIGHLTDGSKIEGILEGTDDHHVIMMTPEEVESRETYDERQPYGYRPRYRRFFRRRFPFYLFAFPFIVPYPFYY